MSDGAECGKKWDAGTRGGCGGSHPGFVFVKIVYRVSPAPRKCCEARLPAETNETGNLATSSTADPVHLHNHERLRHNSEPNKPSPVTNSRCLIRKPPGGSLRNTEKEENLSTWKSWRRTENSDTPPYKSKTRPTLSWLDILFP